MVDVGRGLGALATLVAVLSGCKSRRLQDQSSFAHGHQFSLCGQEVRACPALPPAGASLAALADDQRLYVGAQTQERMFRGDQMGGGNYHHAEMRAGNGSDTPVHFLKSGRTIEIYRVAAHRLEALVLGTPPLHRLRVLVQQPRTNARHLGWWFEQYVLHAQPRRWRWNTKAAARCWFARAFSSAGCACLTATERQRDRLGKKEWAQIPA